MLRDDIARLILPTLEAMGFDLVRVQLSGGSRPILQIMAEPKDEREMSVEDCALLSRAISALLDVEDPIRGAYSLEVSSPGIDRPLMKARDFERFLGHEAKIETAEPFGGQRRFKGKIESVHKFEGKEVITITCDGQKIELPIEGIHKAKLLLTDSLIAEYQAKKVAQGKREDQALGSR